MKAATITLIFIAGIAGAIWYFFFRGNNTGGQVTINSDIEATPSDLPAAGTDAILASLSGFSSDVVARVNALNKKQDDEQAATNADLVSGLSASLQNDQSLSSIFNSFVQSMTNQYNALISQTNEENAAQDNAITKLWQNQVEIPGVSSAMVVGDDGQSYYTKNAFATKEKYNDYLARMTDLDLAMQNEYFAGENLSNMQFYYATFQATKDALEASRQALKNAATVRQQAEIAAYQASPIAAGWR